MPTNAPLNRKLRMGLVGGGQGAFIGRVHATAAILDNRAVPRRRRPLVRPGQGEGVRAGLRHPAGARLRLLPGDGRGRVEAAGDQRIDFVSVATPNHTHFEIAKAFAEAGFNVMCDKPLTLDLKQAEELAKVVAQDRRRLRA